MMRLMAVAFVSLFFSIGLALAQVPRPVASWSTTSRPRGVTLDASGNVWVVGDGSVVRKYSPSGVPLDSWGSSGSGPGQFGSVLYSQAFASNGDTYVPDYITARVERFTSSGAFVQEWSTGGGRAAGITVDPAGNVYVADFTSDRIRKYTGAGAFLAQWTVPGDVLGVVWRAGEIAATSGGTLYRFTDTGTPLGSFPIATSSADDLDVDGSGRYFVADFGTQTVQIYQPTGELVATVGPMLPGLGAMRPQGVTVAPDGSFFVADYDGTRIIHFAFDAPLTVRYDAATGQTPEQTCPVWVASDDSPTPPHVSGGKLILSTAVQTQNTFYTHSGATLSLPSTVILEFRMRFVSGGSSQSSRAPAFAYVETAPFVGSSLFIRGDVVFLTAGDLVLGASANVDTDDMPHTYRMEITGDVVSVYYDSVLLLSGTTYLNPNFSGVPRIQWGEGSTAAFGTSEWYYMQDNAGVSSCSAIAARPPAATCISSASPCMTVPIALSRSDTNPVRGYSVTVQLSPNLQLCGAVSSGGFLQDPQLLVTDNGGGSYTVDEVTLGLPCGATGSGTLFNLPLTSSSPGSVGTVTVTATTLRDCTNGMIATAPGPVASVSIDNVAPVAVTLSALQRRTGNVQPPDGTTDVLVSWTGQEAGSSVSVYRKGFGGYPQYDENGGTVPATPATPAAAASAGWTLASVTTSGGADRTVARDFEYYVAYVTDGCGNVSAVSNQTGGTLNYHLGDYFGAMSCSGNDLINNADASFFGAHYGVSIPINDPLECLDIGPTTGGSVDGRPTTDNKTNFEDLILLAVNYGSVSAPQMKALPVAVAANALSLGVPTLPPVGEVFAVSFDLEGAGNIQGFSAQCGYDAEVVEFLGVEAGELLARQAVPGMVVSSRAGTVDVALLGTGYGMRGRGAIVNARFRVRRAGDAAIVLAAADARDATNQPVTLEGQVAAVTMVAPATTALAPARPTPFRDATVLEYALAHPGGVELTIYAVDGRRVVTLERGERAAGVYRIAWDGRDDRGGHAPAGLYYARLVTGDGKFNRTLVRVR